MSRLGSDDRLTTYLTESLRFRRKMTEEGLLVMLDCAQAIFDAEMQDEVEVAYAQTMVKTALRRKEVTLSNEATAMCKRYALAKNCPKEVEEEEESSEEAESEDEELLEVDVSAKAATTTSLKLDDAASQPIEDYLDDCHISDAKRMQPAEEAYSGIEIEEITDEEADSMLEELD